MQLLCFVMLLLLLLAALYQAATNNKEERGEGRGVRDQQPARREMISK